MKDYSNDKSHYHKDYGVLLGWVFEKFHIRKISRNKGRKVNLTVIYIKV